MKIYMGADHQGFEMKEKLRKWLMENDWDVEDMGAYAYDPADDYTIFAEKVASLVARHQQCRGVLLCGSGVGVDVTANKFDDVRASMGKSPDQVTAGRTDDNMNILVLASEFTTVPQAKKMLEQFLKTPFSYAARHKRRLASISKIEENN